VNLKRVLKTKTGRAIIAGLMGVGLLIGAGAAASGATSAVACKWGSYPLCPRSVAATQVVDGSLPASKLVKADRDAFLKDNGEAKLLKGYDATTITDIGGSFKTGKTALGTFVLPAGVWELKANIVFHTTAAIPAGVRPQFALRVGSTATAFGEDFGTIMGTEISTAADRELTGTTTKLVSVTAPTTVGAYGFGYTDTTGTEGSGKISVSGEVWAVRVG